MLSGILIAGGCTEDCENGALNSTEFLTVENGQVKTADTHRPMTIGRRAANLIFHEHSASVYAIGGCQGPKLHTNSIEILKRNAQSWEAASKINLLEGRSCAMATFLEDKLFVYGGWDGYRSLNSIEYIDLQTNIVRNLFKLPSQIKNGFSIQIPSSQSDQDTKTGSLLTIFGGYDGSRTLRTIFTYDTDKEKGDMSGRMLPQPLECHSAVHSGFLGGTIISGGYNGLECVPDFVFVPDVPTKSCQTLQSSIRLQIPRENHGSAIIDGTYLVIFGGWDGAKALHNVELYQLAKEYPYLRLLSSDSTLLQPRNRPAYCSVPIEFFYSKLKW